LKEDSKIPCAFFAGPSGVGKSTLMRICLAHSWPRSFKVKVPAKFTTRELRSDDEKIEITRISREEFKEKNLAGEFLYSYENYAQLYGIESAVFLKPEANTFYVQALPSSAAIEVKKLISSDWAAKLIRLEADHEHIRQRLIRRGDKISLRETVDRAKGSKKALSNLAKADAVFNTRLSAEDLLEKLEKLFFNKS